MAGAEAGDPAPDLAPTDRTALGWLTGALIEAWPQHERFLRGSFEGYDATDLVAVEDLARRVAILAGDELPHYMASYRWMCAELAKEALYFKKHGRYRLTTFEDAQAQVYANVPFMRRYMQGLLVSQVFWRNHSSAFLHFRRAFLADLPSGFRYLEVGPGHGLFLSVAAEHPACGAAQAWDVSDESLRQTAEALDRLEVRQHVALRRRDVLSSETATSTETFDGIVISEVLEHLERPRDALVALKRHLAPEGRIFINVPVNSPAPDHIHLLPNVNAVRALVEAAGLTVASLRAVPLTGYTLAQAEREAATISCLVVAR